jgi:hypothetical protein
VVDVTGGADDEGAQRRLFLAARGHAEDGLGGLYPAGEGAGFAGGIVSAALDGLRVARAVSARLGAEEG